MTLSEAGQKLARALVRAVNEHGAPNSFSLGELAAHYGGPPARLAGHVALRSRDLLEAALREAGWNVSVRYSPSVRRASGSGESYQPARLHVFAS